MKSHYSFSVLRYIHDVVNGEFVNVGVVIFASGISFFDARCTKKYGRISKFFTDVNGDHFRALMNFIESKASNIQYNLKNESLFDKKVESINELLQMMLPSDDSTLQFSPPGGGLTSDIEQTLNELYDRYIDRFSENKLYTTRDDHEIWKVFRKPLIEKKIVHQLRPHKVIAKNFEYEFEHAWKNGVWRTLEAVSFDLDHPISITDKANKWLGRSISLADTEEKFKLYLLLGKPTKSTLMSAYIKAENILHKIKIPHEFVREDDAEGFAKEIEKDIKEHS